MKRFTVVLAALVLAASVSTSVAYADTIFDFNISGVSDDPHSSATISGSGQFVTSLVSPGTYLITGVTGTVDGFAITNLYAPGTIVGNDDLLVSDPVTSISGPGTVFGIANGQVVVLSGYPNGQGFIIFGIAEGAVIGLDDEFYGPITIAADPSTDPSPVPEPSGLLLIATGLIGGFGSVRRRLQS